MTRLAWMRLAALTRTGAAVAPLLAALVVLGILYGGGQARPAEAYAVSAMVIFPVLAWQTKILLDVEPDIQRQLARIAVGSARREVAAGLLAAAAATGPVIAIALALPWLLGGVTLAGSGLGLVQALLLGGWAHLIMVPPAIALGALSSRVVTASAGRSVAVLVGGAVLAIVLDLRESSLSWLAPGLLGVARALGGKTIQTAALPLLSAHALVWAAVAGAGYVWLRRDRA